MNKKPYWQLTDVFDHSVAADQDVIASAAVITVFFQPTQEINVKIALALYSQFTDGSCHSTGKKFFSLHLEMRSLLPDQLWGLFNCQLHTVNKTQELLSFEGLKQSENYNS